MLRFVTCDAVCSAHRQLHHARRQVELARRNDTDVYVFSHRLDRPWVVFVLTTRITRPLPHPLCHVLVLPWYVAVWGRRGSGVCALVGNVLTYLRVLGVSPLLSC